jgi:hypothetical protein
MGAMSRIIFVVLEGEYEGDNVLCAYGLESQAKAHVERLQAEAKIAWDRDKTVSPGYSYVETELAEPEEFAP